MPYKYAKLRGRIIEVFGSQEKFANEIGLSTNSLSKKMNGKVGFSQRDIVLWSKHLGIDSKDYGTYFFA